VAVHQVQSCGSRCGHWSEHIGRRPTDRASAPARCSEPNAGVKCSTAAASAGSVALCGIPITRLLPTTDAFMIPGETQSALGVVRPDQRPQG
jgi:hypothetical protein